MKTDRAPCGRRPVGANTRTPNPVILESQMVVAPAFGGSSALTELSVSFFGMAKVLLPGTCSGVRKSSVLRNAVYCRKVPQKSFICNYNPRVSKAFLAAVGNYRQYQGLRKMIEHGLQILLSRFDSGRGLQPNPRQSMAALRSRRELPITLTDESDIAAAAITGDKRMPKAG